MVFNKSKFRSECHSSIHYDWPNVKSKYNSQPKCSTFPSLDSDTLKAASLHEVRYSERLIDSICRLRPIVHLVVLAVEELSREVLVSDTLWHAPNMILFKLVFCLAMELSLWHLLHELFDASLLAHFLSLNFIQSLLNCARDEIDILRKSRISTWTWLCLRY